MGVSRRSGETLNFSWRKRRGGKYRRGMDNSVRLLCSPRSQDSDLGNRYVVGGELSFQSLGAGPSNVNASAGAELGFYVRYFESARKPALEDFRLFATLKGQVSRRHDDSPLFSCEPDAVIEYVEQAETNKGAVRVVQLVYEASAFEPAPPSSVSELRLPVAPASAKHAEVGFGLKVGDVSEGKPEQCDVLDVPLRPYPRKLRLRFPKTEATSSTFVLRREVDGFEQIRQHGDDLIAGDEFVDLEFEGVFDGMPYSLWIRFNDGAARPVFSGKVLSQLLGGEKP